MKCMFKSTITLPNGSVAQVESSSVDQLMAVLAANLGVIDAIEVVNQSATQQKVSKTHHTTKEVHKPYLLQGKAPKGVQWSERDIMLIVERLNETGAQHGTVGETVKYVRKNGEQKRNEWTTYLMINRIKRYMFDGKVRRTGLQRYAVKILQNNGIQAGTKEQTRRTPKGKKHFVHWTERDILGIGKIVHDNTHMVRGVSRLVNDYLKKHGDVKTRSDSTIHSTVSDLKLYFTGKNSERVTDHMKRTLTEASLFPSDRGTPVTITRINTPEEA